MQSSILEGLYRNYIRASNETVQRIVLVLAKQSRPTLAL